ncbi:MAG: hypothetical protein ABI411_20880 [Tahibacter sp.]
MQLLPPSLHLCEFACRVTLRRIMILALVLAARSAQAAPEYLIVGDTQGGASRCTYATPQAALDAALANGPELDYVLLTDTVAYAAQALVVGDQSVLIEGGYSDCDLTPSGQQTTIVGDFAHPIIDIQTGGSGARTITLRHLELRSGNAFSGGGGVYLFGNPQSPPYVLIEDVNIHDNAATYGGGIASAFATLAIGKDVAIVQNTARRLGGGLYLQGGTVRIENDRTDIRANRALVDPNFVPSGQGGGIYATGSAGAPLDVSIGDWQFSSGNASVPIADLSIASNRADDKGGGIFLNGPNVSLLAFETSLLDNSAGNNGGGAFLYNGATLQMSRDFPGIASAHCANYLQCNVVRGNSVDAHANYVAAGGGISVQVGTLRLLQTAFLDNIADAASAIDTGSIAGAASPPNTLRLEGVLASRNRCRGPTPQRTCSTIDLGAGADARISYSTFADNRQLPGTFASEIYAYGATTTLRLLSSILITDPTFVVPSVFQGGGAVYQSDCVITNNNGLPPGSTRSQVGNPGFNNPANYDYRLRSASLATDYCDNANTVTDDFSDLALVARGIDDVRHANLHGRFDAGAFESDHIFGAGHE